MENDRPDVKHKIRICMGSSCFARGNQKNLEILESLNLEKQFDCEIELYGSRCENKCSSGPNIEIDGIFYSKINPGSLIDLLNNVVVPADLDKEYEDF